MLHVRGFGALALAFAFGSCVATDDEADQPTSDGHQEVGYTVGGCTGTWLLTTPTAQQCCFTNGGSGQYTLFVRPSDQMVVKRMRNPYGPGTPCKASDGFSACSGADCYYGPFGFARATLWSVGSTPRVHTLGGRIAYCDAEASGTIQWGDLNGTNSPGQGCPGGFAGWGQWDY